MSAAAIPAVVALIAAAISTAGALYVGRRNREASRQVAEFQKELADVVVRRQLCLTLGSRALLVGERAAESRNGLTSLERLGSSGRRDEVRRRLDRLDLACDGFIESWVEVASWNLGPARLGLAVDELSNALETVRLLTLVAETDIARQSLALREVDRIARSIHRLCVEAADEFALPSA